MFGRYDHWRTREDDPGTGNGRPATPRLLLCTRCAFTTGQWAAAARHHAETGHDVQVNGRIVQFDHRTLQMLQVLA